jgi:hypothetical protein
MRRELERVKKTDTEGKRKLESVAGTLGIHYAGKTDDELRHAITKDIKKDRVDL